MMSSEGSATLWPWLAEQDKLLVEEMSQVSLSSVLFWYSLALANQCTSTYSSPCLFVLNFSVQMITDLSVSADNEEIHRYYFEVLSLCFNHLGHLTINIIVYFQRHV